MNDETSLSLSRHPTEIVLLTYPDIPFRRVGDDVNVEVISRQIAPQIELLVRR